MILIWLTNFAFAVGGMIIGILLTACIVAADWHEKPRRHRGWWIEDEQGHMHCTRCSCGITFPNSEPSDYCPCCGAEMKGVRNSGNCDS